MSMSAEAPHLMSHGKLLAVLLVASASVPPVFAYRHVMGEVVSIKTAMTDSSFVKQISNTSSPEYFWDKYVTIQDMTNEMMRGMKEMKLKKELAKEPLESLSGMISEAETTHGGDEHLEGFVSLVKNLAQRLEDKAAREAAKQKTGASEAEKEAQREAQKARWGDILAGKAQCPTGITVQFVKAPTLEEGLVRGQAMRYQQEETILAFDMDGTLVDMRDYYPQPMMEIFNHYAESDKVVITAADNQLGSCGAVTTSLIAPVSHSHWPHAANGTDCYGVVQGATYDSATNACTCP
jgi:hypothetical protein